MGLFSTIFFSCKNTHEIYIYGTLEFKEKEKMLKLSLKEAADICENYIINHNILTEDKYYYLDLICDDNYIFKIKHELYNPKLGRYNLSGIWVNGKTGKIREVKTRENVKVLLEIGKHIGFIKKVREKFKKKCL